MDESLPLKSVGKYTATFIAFYLINFSIEAFESNQKEAKTRLKAL